MDCSVVSSEEHSAGPAPWAKLQGRFLNLPGIETIILYGMSANVCVESHARDAIENGFDAIIIADATAASGDAAYEAAMTNFEFLAHEVVTTDQIIMRPKRAKD